MEEMYRQLQPLASNLRPDQGHTMFTIRDRYGQSLGKVSICPSTDAHLASWSEGV